MQERLESLLKKKGIGPEGSKSLNREELTELNSLFAHPGISLTTKATLLTALLLLEPNKEESEWIIYLKENFKKILSEELYGFFLETSDPFLSIIKKLISKNELSEEECLKGMDFLLDSKTPEFLKGPFLEGERLKRETFKENQIFFNFLYRKAARIEIDTPLLIDICDSYDGSNRSKNFSLFTAALLASLGYPVIVHGIDEVAPKMGVTSHAILKAADKNPLSEAKQAVANLHNPEIGWAYIDQLVFFPELYNLKRMRKEMVKRPFLATFEKLLQPIKVKSGNYIVTGFTHPHYKEELVKQLKEQGKCNKALILKGVEGSTHMSLAKNTTSILFDGKEIFESIISPQDFNIPALEAKQDKSITANDSLIEGMAALKGEKNYARENILYQALVILTKFNLMDKPTALSNLANNLDSGKAFEHWEKGNI